METVNDAPTLNPTARIAKNSLVQMIGGLLNKVLGVLLVIYAARQLGAEGFGVYSFVLSLLGIYYLLTDFGLGTLTTRDLARSRDGESRYASNILLMRLVLSIAAALGMVGTAWVLGQPWPVVRLTAVAALSLFFSSNVDTCAAVFNARERMEVPSLVGVVATTLRVGVSLGALAAGAGLASLLWIYSSASVIQFALLFGLLSMEIRWQFRADWAFWRDLLRQAYPLALAGFFSIIYFKIDSVMLAALAGQKAVGLYNAAYRLLEFTLMVPAYFGGAIFPVIASSYQSNPQRFLLIYRRSLKYMLVASLPLALGVSALSEPMIRVLYGAEYAASAPVLYVLMWSLVLICANSINAPYLIVMGRQRTVTALTTVGMLVNIGLNLYAIPRYGMLGAAWVTLLSEALVILLFLGVLAGPLSLKLRMFRHLVRPAAAGVLMFWALHWVPGWDLAFQIAAGAVVYVGLLFLFGAFDAVDQELFSRVMRPTASSPNRVT